MGYFENRCPPLQPHFPPVSATQAQQGLVFQLDSRHPLFKRARLLASISTTRSSTAKDDFHENWERISQGSSAVTASDLEAYARSHGLPTAYISMFMEEAGKSASGQTITRAQFLGFVTSHERALKKAFQLFDKDGDGKIGVEDLELSLTHVALSCCRTRCIYRAPRGLAHKLLAQTQVAGKTDGREVDFAAFRRFFMLLPRTEMALEFWLRAGAAIDCSEKRPPLALDGVTMQKTSAWGHLFAGAVAGAASRTATAPLETLRLAVMTGTVQASSLHQAATDIVAAHGVRGLYRGNGLNVLRSAPQKALDFFAFDGFKRMLLRPASPGSCSEQRGAQDTHPLHTFTAAGLAGASSWALLYPLETLRSRVTTGAAVAPAGLHGLAALLRNIVAKEGLGGLYRGLGWSMAGIFPEAAMCYGLHDFLKHCYSRAHGGVEPGVGPSLCFGVLSAFAGQLMAFPLETVARRLQVQQSGGGLQAVLRQIMAEGGPLALYRGLGAATLRLVPMAGISFGTYEAVRYGLLALEDAAGAREADQEYEQLHRFCNVPTPGASAARCPQAISPAGTPCATPMDCVPLLAEDASTGGGGVQVVHSYCLPTLQDVQAHGYCMHGEAGGEGHAESCLVDGGRREGRRSRQKGSPSKSGSGGS